MTRGRPKGTGYDDRSRIGEVYAALMYGNARSRRHAILALVGDHPSDIRRIERKLNLVFRGTQVKTAFDSDIDLDAYVDIIPREEAVKAAWHVHGKGKGRYWYGHAIALLNAIYLVKADPGGRGVKASDCLDYGRLAGLARPELAAAGSPVLSDQGREQLLAFLDQLPGFAADPMSRSAHDYFGYLAMIVVASRNAEPPLSQPRAA